MALFAHIHFHVQWSFWVCKVLPDTRYYPNLYAKQAPYMTSLLGPPDRNFCIHNFHNTTSSLREQKEDLWFVNVLSRG
jgi:hypothetical protein